MRYYPSYEYITAIYNTKQKMTIYNFLNVLEKGSSKFETALAKMLLQALAGQENKCNATKLNCLDNES